jgi:diaminopimelate epimerase
MMPSRRVNKIPFTKMHGAGNDFVVIDATRQRIVLNGAQLRAIADRRRGVGADQILFIEPAPASPPGETPVDFTYRIFNADGGEVEQCGNGARAFARFVHEKGLAKHNPIRVSTLGGIIEPHLEEDGSVTVDMGAPRFEPAAVPFDPRGLEHRRVGAVDWWDLEVRDGIRAVAVVSMGNPHVVQIVETVDLAPVGSEGPLLECHERFPQRVNAGFVQIVGPTEIRLRVWERGAGETLSCGTGACAAAVLGILSGRLDAAVTVHTRGGDLRIVWDGPGRVVRMNGPAVAVFDGELDLSALGA